MSVWLEVGLHRQKKILVCNLYRDWQYLGQDSVASLATSAQLSRWLTFIDQWETAILENKEVHVMGSGERTAISGEREQPIIN